jgi:hypothetical protein
MDNNREVAFFVATETTHAVVTDLLVQNTRERACADTTCPDFRGGNAVGAFLGATMDMSRFVLSQGKLCGLQVATDGQVDLLDGVMRDHPIGVCLQNEGYELDRLTNGVRFVDNGVNLESTSLPVPGLPESVP